MLGSVENLTCQPSSPRPTDCNQIVDTWFYCGNVPINWEAVREILGRDGSGALSANAANANDDYALRWARGSM